MPWTNALQFCAGHCDVRLGLDQQLLIMAFSITSKMHAFCTTSCAPTDEPSCLLPCRREEHLCTTIVLCRHAGAPGASQPTSAAGPSSVGAADSIGSARLAVNTVDRALTAAGEQGACHAAATTSSWCRARLMSCHTSRRQATKRLYAVLCVMISRTSFGGGVLYC